MFARRTFSRAAAMLVIAAAALLVPQASTAQTIYACVKLNSGQIRYLGIVPGACLPSELPISWSVQGPAGPQGSPGTPADMTQVMSLQSAVTTLQAAVGNLQSQLGGLQGQVNALAGLSNRVANLETNNKWRRFDTVVDCAAGQSVMAALQQAAAFGSANIGIRGVCNEAVQISNHNTRLYGVGEGAGLTLQASMRDQSVLDISATGVQIEGLTLTGGSHTLAIDRRASARVSSTTVAGSGFHGILVSGGQLTLRQSSVTGAASTGVFAWAGSVVNLERSSITGSATSGLMLNASVGFIDQGSVISGNREGVAAYNGSAVHLRVVTIRDHRNSGVVVQGASSVVIDSGTVITANAGNGIELHDTSVMSMWGGSPFAQVTANGWWGVYCNDLPAVAQVSGSIAQAVLTGNGTGAVRCPGYY